MPARQPSEFFLCSERLGFRHWREDDILLARELWGDPQVTRLFSRDPFTDSQIQERLTAEIERARNSGVQYWPMFELIGLRHLGCAGLRPYPDPDGKKVYELGFHLKPSAWGKGFATEAASAVLEYAVNELGATAIFAGHHPENVASGKVLLKLGFIEKEAQFYEPTGLFHCSYMYYPPYPSV